MEDLKQKIEDVYSLEVMKQIKDFKDSLSFSDEFLNKLPKGEEKQ